MSGLSGFLHCCFFLQQCQLIGQYSHVNKILDNSTDNPDIHDNPDKNNLSVRAKGACNRICLTYFGITKIASSFPPDFPFSSCIKTVNTQPYSRPIKCASRVCSSSPSGVVGTRDTTISSRPVARSSVSRAATVASFP